MRRLISTFANLLILFLLLPHFLNDQHGHNISQGNADDATNLNNEFIFNVHKMDRHDIDSVQKDKSEKMFHGCCLIFRGLKGCEVRRLWACEVRRVRKVRRLEG